ncbi:alpha-L-rhamnosidase C-terminal domain-containing protein [Acetatifactor aquisgranensis]|uniref:alpha-L-rhamnosidase C-terminal domain-containing protein n=1 Tax=Acetatifactor aquisgranensis TaxID=2941233 RepID=UPI00203E0C6A|nr:alpha-L-rhamnosidase C-terminal domain-containing protein [Acetatifactor aquisgranensis]MCI8543558.1 hypothetical protein [Lachnospiraceae bacterium]
MASPMVPWAKGRIGTVYGEIAVDYKLGDHFTVTVPPNTKAEVFVPRQDGSFTRHSLTSGTYSLT